MTASTLVQLQLLQKKQGKRKSEMNQAEFELYDDEDFGSGGGGKWLDKPGVYHLLCDGIDQHPTKKDGEPINGIRVSFSVLAGGDGDQAEKVQDLLFFRPGPKPDDDEKLKGWRMTVQKQSALLIALGLTDPAGLRKRKSDAGVVGSGGTLAIDLDAAKNRQFIAELRNRKLPSNNGSGQSKDVIDLHYANIWHVDDPAGLKALDASKRNQAAISLIPKEQRRSAEDFAAAAKKNEAPVAQVARPAQAAAIAAAVDDLGDL